MKQNEIIEMARQAGMYQDLNVSWNQSIQNFAELVAAKEREACAKVCDNIHAKHEAADVFSSYAEAIRARGEA